MQLFLTSAAGKVLSHLVKKLPLPTSNYQAAFITTAADPYQGNSPWVYADQKALEATGIKTNSFSIDNLSENEIRNKLDNSNLIFVAGGNTFHLLDQSLKTGFSKILIEKLDQNIPYIGSSAGSMLLGKHIDLVYSPEDHQGYEHLDSSGLGYIDLSIQPHWGDPDLRKEYSSDFDKLYCQDKKIILLSDNQYLWIQDNSIQFIQT